MLPKRKLIKKRHRRLDITQDHGQTLPNTLVQRLKSTDSTVREQALTYIASLCTFNITPTEVTILAEMIGILYQGNNALVYQCLFALANLCEIEARVTSRLFELGLDKALIKLNSADKDLLKPIMVLMIALHDDLPQQYQYLQRGVESSLTVTHLSSTSHELVLQFLVRIQSVGLKEDIYQKLYEMFKNQQKLKIRSSCLNILLRHPIIRNRINKQALEFCDQIINDIDLNSEYKTNILDSKSQINKAKQMETDEMEQQGEQLLPLSHVNYQTFNDAVEAVQILFQALLIIMEEGWEEDGLVQEDCAEEQNQPIDIQKEKVISQGNSQIRTSFLNFFTVQPAGLIRDTVLCFMEGQNIVNLSLRLLSYLSSADRQAVSTIICKCFQNIITVCPPAQVMSEVLNVGLYMLLKCGIGNQVRNLLIELGQKIFELNDIYKECWICLLQLYSIHFNPQKGKVLEQQNIRIGLILKKLILNIPYLQLEEWRGQTIDTLFDIYSNEQFDKNFISLGLMQLLEGVQQRAGLSKKKRFIRQVLADINRFLEYKKKMIKF